MTILGTDVQNDEYDVVICGTGIAGQTLARQLKLNFPDISVLMLEKAQFPMPLAAHKVGESTVESAAFYLAEVLQLREYLLANQFRKHGLRYFWSSKDGGCLSERPEIGLQRYGPYSSYQLDLGKLENDLARINQEMGVQLIDGAQVNEIEISQDGELHQIWYQSIEHAHGPQRVKARWVVDAMGRRRFLQRKLGLGVKSTAPHSAVWWRVKGRADVCDLVPESKTEWHERVPGRMRYFSTTHMMGDGYWVWLIPLSSGHTSIGIVTREKIQPLTEYSTPEKAMKWLEVNEPALHQYLTERQFERIDFLVLRDYSHSSKQIFSKQRWACIGNAGLFSDPFYSPGLVTIGFENTMLTKMIELERAGQLTAPQVLQFNRVARGICEFDTFLIQTPYEYFKHHHIWSLRYLWALSLSWGLVYPQMFNSLYLDAQKSQAVRELAGSYSLLAFKLESFWKQWAAKTQSSFTFKFIDYLQVPFIRGIYDRNTKRYNDFAPILDNYRYALARMEEFLQVVFLMAVRDVMPEKLAALPNPLWVNLWAISLSPERWEQDGLYRPKTAPRDLSEMRAQVKQLYQMRPLDNREAGIVDVEGASIPIDGKDGGPEPSASIGAPFQLQGQAVAPSFFGEAIG
jgi:flavin-dependent dehydrogenase